MSTKKTTPAAIKPAVVGNAAPETPAVDPAIQAAADAAAKAEADKAEKAKQAAAKKEADAVAAKIKKDAADAAKATKKAEAEKAVADKKAKAEADKKAKIDAAAAAKLAKEANKQPEQNGVRRPKPDGACGKVWALADELSGKLGNPVPAADLLTAGTAAGLNPSNVRAEYAAWKKFHGLTGRIAAPAPAETAPAA